MRGYRFTLNGSIISVYANEHLLDQFRMPRDCKTLDDFITAFWSMRQLGQYKVENRAGP